MSDHEEQSYGLVLPFDTDDEEFVRGWALGAMWKALELQGWAHSLIYARSAEMVMRMAEAKGLPFTATVYDDGFWMEATIGTPVEQEA